MVYELLNDLREYMACNADHESNSIEQGLLDRIEKVLKTVHKKDDTDFLMPNELLVRICPSTKQPVLICHSGDGYAVCLHNDTVEEDIEDVKIWLETAGKECNGNRHLTPENETDLDPEFGKILESDELREAFIETVNEEISSDDDSYDHKASYLIKAYRADDCDGMLMALCGWSMKTLLEKTQQKI